MRRRRLLLTAKDARLIDDCDCADGRPCTPKQKLRSIVARARKCATRPAKPPVLMLF